MPVVGPHRCFMVFHWCSSWTRLSCPLWARQMPWSRSSRRAENCGKSAVAVPLQGRRHPRRCAETSSHGLTVQQITEILLLQYIDKVFDDLVVQSSRFLGCSRGEDGLDPTVAPRSRVQTWRRRSRSHSCNVDAGHCCSHACRCATTGAGDGRDSAVNCGGSAVALIDCLVF